MSARRRAFAYAYRDATFWNAVDLIRTLDSLESEERNSLTAAERAEINRANDYIGAVPADEEKREEERALVAAICANLRPRRTRR